jgi:hypothetical protein
VLGGQIWVRDSDWFEAFIVTRTKGDIEYDGNEIDPNDVVDVKGLGTLESYRSAIHKHLEIIKVKKTNTYNTGIASFFAGLSRKSKFKRRNLKEVNNMICFFFRTF